MSRESDCAVCGRPACCDCFDESGGAGGESGRGGAELSSTAVLRRGNADTEWLRGWALTFCGAKARAEPTAALAALLIRSDRNGSGGNSKSSGGASYRGGVTGATVTATAPAFATQKFTRRGRTIRRKSDSL